MLRAAGVAAAVMVALAVCVSATAGRTDATGRRVHARVTLPKDLQQSFGLFRVRVKSAAMPRVSVRLANLSAMPAGIRAAAARTKIKKAGAFWTFDLAVAINNLGSRRLAGARAPGAADIIIEVFSGKEFAPEREFVDDCLTRAEQRAWEKTRKLFAVFYALGHWPSPPADIFLHTLQDEKSRCP